MPIYRIQAPNGLTYQIEGPEGASQEDVAMAVLAQNPEAGKPFKEASASFGDTAVAGLQSAVGSAKSTLQGFGAEAPGVETLGNLQKGLGQLYTPERQAEQARRAALEKAATKSGSTLEEIKASAAGVTEAPIQATASAIGSSIPTVALSIGAAALAVPAAAALGLIGAPALAFAAAVGIGTKYALGALQGAGSVKGSIYDAVKEEVAKQYPDLSKEEVSKIALEAQSFTGKNWDNILAGTGIGAVAGGTGLEKDLLKKLSKPVAEAAAKKAGEEVAKKGIIAGTKRAAGAGLKEAVPEAIQGGQEQFAANVAQTREGFETPAMEGVLGAATKEGLMGMLGGSAVSPFTGAPTTPTAQQAPDQPTISEAAAQAAREARAQEQMGVKQGRAAREGEKLIDAEAKAEADQQQTARVEAEKAAATELQTLRAQRQAELEQTFPKDYSDVMQKTDAYATLFQEKQALVNQTQTKEVKARIKTVDGLIQGIIEEDTRVPNEFKRMQAENAKVTKNLPPDLQAKYAATAFTIPEPQQMEIRAATVEQAPVQQTDLLGQPIEQEAPAAATPDKFKTVQTVEEAQAALDLQNRREAREGQADRNAAKDAGQLGLFNRVGTPTAEAEVLPPKIIVKKPPVTEPTVRQKPTPETVEPVITADTLGVLGIGPTAVMRKPGHAIQGLDITKPEDAADVKNMLTIYKEGRSPAIVQKIDTFLARPEFQALPTPAPKAEAAPAPAPVVEAPKLQPIKITGQSAEKKAANKAAQPSAKKAKDETAKPIAEPITTPTVTKAVEAPPAPAPIKVVKKTEPKKVEPKKIEVKKAEPKKVEPKKLEAPKVAPKKEEPKVAPKKEEPKVDKTLDKARETVDDLDLDPETTKTKVKSFAKRLHKAGLIDDISLNAVESISKDKDMGYEDLLDEVRFALDAYERQQGQAPETKPEPKKVTDESNVIEGETRVIPDNQVKLLEGPVGRLQDDQVEELEEFYGVKKDNPEFWKRLQEDVTLFAEKGAKAVKQAIREIIRQVQAGVLAVGVIFNPGNISAPEAFVLHSPVSVTTTQEVKAKVPASVASKMSDGAKEAYEILIPAMQGKNGDKLMVFVDKPTGRIFIFDADGKPVLDKKVLIGLAKGDLYKGNNDLPQNRITPAGLFGIKIIDAAKGGSAKKTAGDYDFGKVFALEDPDAVVTIMHSVWLKEKDAAQRQAALQSESTTDSRFSFGCINIDKGTYKYLLDNFQAQMDGAKMFVVPDNQADTRAFLMGEKSSGDVLVREAVKPVTKTTTQTRDSAFAQEAKAGTLGREQGLPPKEPLQKPAVDLSFVDRPVAVEADLQVKLQEGDVRGALQAILKAPKGIYNDLDRAVARRILLSNKLPTIELVAEGALGREGDKIVAGQYDALTDKIQLVNGYAGAHVLLHELVHGFVHRAIALQGAGKLNNAGIRNLQELYDYVAKAKPEIIKEYGMTNLSEFASEAMSNKAFQAALTGIPYRRVNALTQFAQSVLRALGLSSDTKFTALAAAMISVDSVMTEGRKLQEALTGTEVEGSLPGIAPVMVKELDDATRQSIKAIQAQFPVEDQAGVGGVIGEAYEGVKDARKKSGILTAFRQQAVDKYATVESKVSTLFSQGVRDYFGNINPMVLTRQAEDSAKIVMDFFRAGGIRLTKDGLVETYKQGKSMVTALQKVGEYARANDLSYVEAKSEVSTILEGHRLHNINEEHNKPLEASALLLEQQGKNKEADAERKKKIFMHMDLKQIASLEDAYQKSAGIKEIQDELNATRTQAVDLMIATGRLTKEQGQFWKDNTAYVPFSRVFEEAAPNMVYRGKGLGVLRKLPNMEGSLGRPVKNVLDSYANRLSWMVEDSMKNHAAVKLLETMEAGGFAQEVSNKLKAENPNLVVSLFRDGKPVLFEVQNEYDMLAFQQAPELMNWFIKGLGATSRFLRLSITAMPPFAIKQVVEDAQRAAFYSGVERPLVVAMKTLYNMPRTFFGEVTGRKSPMVKRMEELGIVGDYDFNIYQPVNDIEKEIGVAKRGIGGKIFHRLEQFTKASDLSARLAVYEETMRDTKGDEVLAQTRARELINFTRRGSSSTMRTAARVIPFFNAYAQGMDVLYRSATGLDSSASVNRAAARKMFLSRIAIMTSLGFVYALAMGDDEGYKNAPEEVRDNNWLLPNGYKFGVPKELGFLFKSIPERIVDYYRRYGTDEEQSVMQALGSVAKGAMSAYGTPNVTPSYIKPFLEAATNHSFFLQRELESASMKRLEPGKRYTSSTSELAKVLGEQTNVSPIKIDNFIRGMFGMAGSTTLLITDAILNPTRPDRPLYQMPFTSLFLYNTEGGRAKNEFYDLQEKVSQADTTFKSLRETSPDKALAYYEKNVNLIAVAPILNSSLQQLSKSRKLRQQLETLTDEQLGMTSKERREAIDNVLKQENDSLKYVRMLDKQVRNLGK
jgi:hypothetical protein